MSFIEFKNVSKSYDGKTKVLDNLNIKIEEGNLITLLGPSGCGKSTLLRILAGFEEINEGQIFLNGEDISHLEPRKRGVGMVFQNYSLFPNMNVEKNIKFGLKMNKKPKNEIDSSVKKIMDIVDLTGKEKAMPHELSGGQKQRVALARALVTKPKVLLLDEPLSAIDAKLRKSLQISIKEIQQKFGLTTLFVTHDQDEAMIMSDYIHILNEGKIEQSGSPNDLYTHPKTNFSATFIGHYNILSPQQFLDFTGIEQENNIALRPEAMEILNESTKDKMDGIKAKGRVISKIIRGNILSYKIDVGGISFRVDELYRSFNFWDIGSEVEIFVEHRNCIKLEG